MGEEALRPFENTKTKNSMGDRCAAGHVASTDK